MRDWQDKGIVADSDAEDELSSLVEEDDAPAQITSLHNAVEHTSKDTEQNTSEYLLPQGSSQLKPETFATDSLSQHTLSKYQSPSNGLPDPEQTTEQPSTPKSAQIVSTEGEELVDRPQSQAIQAHVDDAQTNPDPYHIPPSLSLRHSSSLSTLHSNDDLQPLVCTDGNVHSTHGENEATSKVREVVDLLQEHVETLRTRNLRQRNPIQLHPYGLENEAYRRAMRNRGIRPIHMAPTMQQDSAPFENSLESKHDPSSQTPFGSSSPFPSSPPQQLSAHPGTMSSQVNDDSDELPAVEALMRHSQRGEVRLSFKRRKIGQLQRVPKRLNGHAHDGQKAVVMVPTATGGEGHYEKENISPGNPHHTTLKRKRRRKFKAPLIQPEGSLPTPAASSDISRQLDRSRYTTSESDSDAVRPSRRRMRHNESPLGQNARVVLSSSSSSSSESQANESDNGGLRKVQKRIKGVLPASWLRFDRQVGAPGPRPQQQGEIAVPDKVQTRSPVKGLAKRISRPNSSRGANGIPTPATERKFRNGFSDEQSPQESKSDRGRNQILNEASSLDHENTREQDVALGVETDAMVVSSGEEFAEEALQAPVNRHRNKQSRLDDGFVVPESNRPKVSLPRHSKTTSKSKRSKRSAGLHTASHRKQWVRRKRVPRLNILDAPETAEQAPVPNFVKVAKRQALRQTKPRRQSPSQKLLSMQTQQEGADVDAVLREWTAGRITRKKHTRQPSTKRSDEEVGCRIPDERDFELAQAFEQAPVVAPAEHHTGIKPQRYRQPRLASFPIIQLDPLDDPLEAKPDEFHITQKALPAAQARPRDQSVPTLGHCPGQLEQLQEEHYKQYPQEAFHLNLHELSRRGHLAQGPGRQRNGPLLERFLNESVDEGVEDASLERPKPMVTADQGRLVQEQDGSRNEIRKRRARKRRPRKIELEQIEAHRQPNHAELPESSPAESQSGPQEPRKPLHGLLPFGSYYSSDFGIAPLPAGVCFRSDSFIGSGEFARALATTERDLDQAAGHCEIVRGTERIQLGQWREDTAQAITVILEPFLNLSTGAGNACDDNSKPSRSISDQDISSLRGLSRFLARNLSFVDPIDRKSFVLAITSLIDSCLANNIAATGISQTSRDSLYATRINLHLLVMSFQAWKISQHSMIDLQTNQTAEATLTKAARALSTKLFGGTHTALADFHDPVNIRMARENGIQGPDAVSEALVCLYHISTCLQIPALSFWTLAQSRWLERLAPDTDDIRTLESIWQELFAVLPLLEIDRLGLLRIGARKTVEHSQLLDCTIAKDLLLRTLTFVESMVSGPSLNDYVRVVLIRCDRLVRIWGWARCESMIGVAYDFFAKRGLTGLPFESSNGSSKFLENLDIEVTPCVDASDPSYQIFLKLLANGLISMQRIYTDKKARNIAWRFVPNHGRNFQRDEALRQSDLNALRNQHDLLSVLYCASPPSMRPSLTPLRNLVDFKSSHAEVCRVNNRAWSNLTRYQLSTDEPSSCVDKFVPWFDDIVQGCVFQHQLARSEAEEMAKNMKTFFSWDVLEATVRKNQSAVEAILKTVFASLADAVESASNHAAARALFEQIRRTAVFDLQSSTKHAISAAIKTNLRAYQSYLSLASQETFRTGQNSSEDSQDYGDLDLDDLDVVSSQDKQRQPLRTIVNELWETLGTALAVDKSWEESSVLILINVHALAASQIVKRGHHDWSEYLDNEGSKSWVQIPQSTLVKKLLPLHLTNILEHDLSAFCERPWIFLLRWLMSLVDREAMLKYQHRLTAALLGHDLDHPLLRDLPVARESSYVNSEISLDIIRERRVDIIEVVLLNMRQLWDSTDNQQDRHEMIALTKQLMAAMKSNYLESQSVSTPFGSYIPFVQSIVQLLYQYTAPIAPVDKFFTDRNTFPLPPSDPHYGVGRLRSFGVGNTLASEKSRKQLAIFLQTIVERAVIEGHQTDLQDQLVEAARTEVMIGNSACPWLPMLLIGSVFPAYFELAAKDVRARAIGVTLLVAVRRIIEGLSCNSSEMVQNSLKILSSSLGPESGNEEANCNLSNRVHLDGHFSASSACIDPNLTVFVRNELQAILDRNWTVEEETQGMIRLFIRRGGEKVKVNVSDTEYEEEKERLREAIEMAVTTQ